MEILTGEEIKELKKFDLRFLKNYLNKNSNFDGDKLEGDWKKLIATCENSEEVETNLKAALYDRDKEIERLNKVIDKMDDHLVRNGKEIIEAENKRADMQFKIDTLEKLNCEFTEVLKEILEYADEGLMIDEHLGDTIEKILEKIDKTKA